VGAIIYNALSVSHIHLCVTIVFLRIVFWTASSQDHMFGGLLPFVENRGAKIYWDEQGFGEPLLLVMGLSYPSYMWHRTRPYLARGYRTIALDNRGVGQSDAPPGMYSIALMASDAAAVLDAAGVHDAHIFGVSMGGMIAQEFALNYSNRVRSLILGCTTSGGPHAVLGDPAALQILMRQGMTPEEANESIIPYLYDAGTPRTLIDEDMSIRMRWYPSPQGYAGQLQGVIGWEAYSRIAQITAPTLVIHGESDRLIPPANALLIARRIPGARLVLIPRAGHIFATDQPDIAASAIEEFLAAQNLRIRASP
jgi:pimeloyl-ACP methyl ester carboxylesterase